MELTNVTELNDAISSDFIDFQDSLAHAVPSSDHYMDDDTLGKLLAEVHREYADYYCPEGVSVSPSSMSVIVDRVPIFSVAHLVSCKHHFCVTCASWHWAMAMVLWHRPFLFECTSVLSDTSSPYSPKCPATFVNVTGLFLGTKKVWAPPTKQINIKMRRALIPGWSRLGTTVVTLLNTREGTTSGMRVSRTTLPRTEMCKENTS